MAQKKLRLKNTDTEESGNQMFLKNNKRSIFFLLFYCSQLYISLTFSKSTAPTPPLVFNSAVEWTTNNQKFLLIGAAIEKTGEMDESFLIHFNTKDQKTLWIPLKDTLVSQHIIGVFKTTSQPEEKFLILSQLRKAGLSKITLSEFNLKNQRFKELKRDIHCVNVEKINIENKAIYLQCGEDALFPPPKKSVKLNTEALNLEKQEIEWLPRAPNSMEHAESLIYKLQNKTLILKTKDLLKAAPKALKSP